MKTGGFIVGCVQVNPGDDRQANIEHAAEGVRAAARQGASLVLLPEYFSFLHASGAVMRSQALREQEDPALPCFQRIAREQGVWILIGSLALATDEEKLANRSFLISDQGEVVAKYDKLHMFDATLPNGRVIRESSTYLSGSRAVVASTPWARLGMSICYDVRFPALYRALSQAGADLLLVPSAFTRATGTVHWKSLLQARAIENGAYVLAPATCGSHPGGHQTYGHSMIIDPNGQVLAEAGDEPSVICASIDIAAVPRGRASLPLPTTARSIWSRSTPPRNSMSRFEVLQREQMSPRQREVADAIASGPRGALKGPFLALIHNPELASRLQALGEHLRFNTGLPQHLVEVAILVTARRWSCDYEWAAHARIAREAGLRDEVIDAIAVRSRPERLEADEALLLDFADDTVWRGEPSDAAFDAVVARFGRATALDLLAVCGYYSLLAFVLNTARLALPPGATPLAPLP